MGSTVIRLCHGERKEDISYTLDHICHLLMKPSLLPSKPGRFRLPEALSIFRSILPSFRAFRLFFLFVWAAFICS